MTKKNVDVKKDGKVIHTYEIDLDGLNYAPKDSEYVSAALRCCHDDGLLPDDNVLVTFEVR